MNIRPKTVRRLMILFSALLIFAGIIATWLMLSQRRIRAQIAQQRADAITAYEGQDYAGAVRLFADYLNRSHAQGWDAEAVFDYGKSRMNTPSDGSRHVFEAIGMFERYLQLGTTEDPRGQARRLEELNEANHLLLKLYVQALYTKDAARVAGKLLAANPNDTEALENLIRALKVEGKAPEALEACRKLNTLIPPNLEWQIEELRLLGATGKQPAVMIARAKELASGHGNDPVFQALLSWADLALGNDPTGAKQAIEAAAKLPPGNPETVLQIVRLLDLLQEFSQADDLLERASSAHPNDSPILRTIVGRAWQRQGLTQVLNRLTGIDPKTADPTLIGYKATALFQNNQASAAAPLLDALAVRKDDVSKAWVITLATEFGKDPIAKTDAIRKFGEAMRRDMTNPAAPYFLAQTWARMGEVDQAMRFWTDAAQRAPSWALPYCLISRALCDAERFPEGLRAAELARQRAPGTQLVETSYARAWYGLEFSGGNGAVPAQQSDSLFALLDTIQKTWKNDPATLPQYVAMLAQRGDRTRAVEALGSAIAVEPALPIDTLVHLSAVSHDTKLGLERQLLDRAEGAHGASASVAVAKAMLMVEAGKSAEAVAGFETASSGHGSEIDWQMAGARLHDALGDSEAAGRWAALGVKYPDSFHVQLSILQSRAHLVDRDLWRQTIDRIKALGGTDGLRWQIEDARWRLAGRATDAEMAAAVTNLQRLAGVAKSMPEVHRILAELLLRSDAGSGVSRAVSELTIAHDLRPGDFETTSKLAQLLMTQGARDRAGTLVDAVANEPGLSAARRMWAGAMYADLGQVDRAIALLKVNAADGSEPARETLLAQFYRRAGRNADAAAQYQKILDDPASTVEGLAAGADFFATQKQLETAERFLARIEKNSPAAGAVDILRSRVQQMAGQNDKAVATLNTAIGAHPTVEQLWQELAGLYLRMGKINEAQRTAAVGASSVAASPKLAAMKTQIERLRLLAPEQVGPLIEVISNDPQQPVAEKAMSLLADAKTRKLPSDQVLASLRALADQNAGFLPLQKLMAQRYATAGRLKDAADIAARASAASPEDVETLRLLCAIQTASGKWDTARQTATRWRQLTGGNTPDADLAIALTYMRQAKPDATAAIAQLARYVVDGAPPAYRQAALPLYCDGLVVLGKTDEARAILEPLLAESAKWQSVWLELATVHKDEGAATAWMNRFVELVPSDTAEKQLAVADAWEQVGNRFDSTAAHRAARVLLEPVIASQNVPAKAWSTWAGINQAADNLPETERAWREYLKAAPAQPLAENNLAYVLMLQGSPAQLAEAEKLARSAIAREPGISTLYDTLARVQLRSGKTDEAIKTFRTALERNASNVDAMIGLAEVLQARPQDRDEVKSLLTRIDAAMQDGPPVASPVRKQLDRVKSALSSSSL